MQGHFRGKKIVNRFHPKVQKMENREIYHQLTNIEYIKLFSFITIKFYK